MNSTWKNEKERGSAVLISLICWIALHLGRGTARLVLIPIDAYFLLRLPAQRKASKDYLQRILNRDISWLDTARHIHCFASTILDRVFFLSGQFHRFDIKIHNQDVVMERVNNGQGCILLGSHLGSFEVLRSLGMEQSELKLKIIMDKVHNTKITKVFDQLNSGIMDTVIELDGPDSILQLQETLNNGGLIGLLGDRVTTDNKVVSCQFLGGEVELPANPYLLAHILKVPVILFFGLYRGGNKYDIHFELFTDSIKLTRNQRMGESAAWAQKYADRLGFYAHKAPFNWFNFFPFWNK